jgi:type III secretion protein V
MNTATQASKFKLFGSGAGAFLPLGLIGMVLIILVPMPTFLMDLLIGVSLASSLGMLVLALHVERLLHLSTFPSLLLITTLLRLALSIATTKLILLHAHAGQLIEVFGKVVVGGNIIVGLVIFVIITLVQFIVIAKGSERVAEVGARFTLDAMPGKQMSIEADVRAGAISMEDARHKRAELDLESQFHGSMDGAMKFVKGDAIATLLIALVNIIAGLAVGVGANGMTFPDALARYTILTVGDGMVAQVPSLVTSVAAGILITRVSNSGGGRLSDEIRNQIAAQPFALLLIGGVLMVAAMVPGLPHIQFAVLGAIIAFAGWAVMKGNRARAAQPVTAKLSPEEVRLAEVTLERQLPSFAPGLWVAVSPGMTGWFNTSAAAQELSTVRMRLLKRYGLPMPKVRFFVDEEVPENCYVVHVFDLVVGTVGIPPNYLARKGLHPGAPNEAIVNIPYVGTLSWVPAAEANAMRDPQGPQWLTVYALIALHLEAVAVAHAETLLGLEEAYQMITKFERDMPELTKEAMKASPLPRTSDVLRKLVSERVSIRNMRAIMESLLNCAGRERDNAMLADQVRIDLGVALVQRFLDANSEMRPIVMVPEMEQTLASAVQMGPRGPILALTPDMSRSMHEQLAKVLQHAAPEGQEVPMVVSPEIRRSLAKLLAPRFPQLCVFSYPELSRDVTIKPLAVLTTGASS